MYWIINRQNILSSLMVTVIALALGVAGLNLLWLFESSPLTYTDLPFKVHTVEVPAGKFLSAQIDRCSGDKITRVYAITRELLNIDTRVVTPLSTHSVTTPPGCVSAISSTEIPANLPPGLYIERGAAHIEGHVKHFVVYWTTEPFRVTPPKPSTTVIIVN